MKNTGFRVTDFHTHILPGVDHGSYDLSTSLEQIRQIAAAGVDRVVATSHFYPTQLAVDEFLKKRNEACGRLLNAASGKCHLEVALGAEVLICPGIDEMEGLERLCVEGTKVLLLEMPMHNTWSDELLYTVENITELGIIPVMAHIDRYPAENVEMLMELDVKAQINTGMFGKLFFNMPKNILEYIRSGQVVAIGSDIHKTEEKQYKAFKKALNSLGDYTGEIMCRTDELLDGAEFNDVFYGKQK